MNDKKTEGASTNIYSISENTNLGNDCKSSTNNDENNNVKDENSQFLLPQYLKFSSGNKLDLDVENNELFNSLDEEDKAEALEQMQKMMHRMQGMIIKLENIMVNPDTQLNSP